MKVIFLCTGNSARSIMAEALLNHHGKGQYEVFSAGTEPHGINPQTLDAISYFGLSTNNLKSKHIDQYTNEHFDYVITLCDKAAKACDHRLSGTHCIAWDFQAPNTRVDNNPFVKTMQELNERIKMFVMIQDKQPAQLTPTQFYKALADDIRLKTLLIISVEQEACVCELMTALNQDSQPKVSRHLAQLKKVGILSVRKHQQWVFYSLNRKLPEWMKQTIASTLANEPNFIEQELARLNNMGERPIRLSTYCK
jgi:protein-tyrosine-phosphatase/DNA-binding transcriptional ArsR family regulator